MTAEEEIRRRILAKGPITFAEFMGLALFWPNNGYYTGLGRIGSSGDFYTSPHAHPAFGALIAVQLHQMWQVMGKPTPFTVVEMGAGNGRLCQDLTGYAAGLPGDFAPSLRYICLDIVATGGVESGNARESGEPSINRVASLFTLGAPEDERLRVIPLKGIQGCILSNEFLDAFPVHQVTSRQGNLKEIHVMLIDNELGYVLEEPSTPRLASRLEDLGIELGEGQTVEINLGIDVWAEQVASVLDTGFILTVDYGQLAPELYSMDLRPRGTLTTFYQHTQTDTPLRRIGRQDMTAQVDFTTLMKSGSRSGLETLGFTTQRRFLNNLGLDYLRRGLRAMDLPRRQLSANNAGMLDLVRMGGLGDFKVLAQGKNVGNPDLWGFQDQAPAQAIDLASSVPLLDASHMPLMEGRYPAASVEFDWDPSTGIEASGREGS